MYRPMAGKKWFMSNAYIHSQIFMSFSTFGIILETFMFTHCLLAARMTFKMLVVFIINYDNANNLTSIITMKNCKATSGWGLLDNDPHES